jgi:multidrug efflux pump
VFYVLIRNYVGRKEARKAAKAQRVQNNPAEAH